MQEAEFQMKLLANETRFILAVVSGDLVVSNRKKADIVTDLEGEGYDKMPVNKKVNFFNSFQLPIASCPAHARAVTSSACCCLCTLPPSCPHQSVAERRS